MTDESKQKPCQQCGAIMMKTAKLGAKGFAKRRFCSPACGHAAKRGTKVARPKVVGADDDHYGDLSHGDKVSIADETRRIGENERKQRQSLSERLGECIEATGAVRAPDGSDAQVGASDSNPAPQGDGGAERRSDKGGGDD